ncbi:MAG: monovalent cation/H(+) antiporter subunit G [Defluviitaleaceae bacterium]|nr:monovalent cation/H(+) antiporter subunit G [Defluviitaleaceae bacterium]
MENLAEIIGNIIIIAGIIFMIFGLIGLFKFKGFYERILATSKVDTVGMLTIIIGLTVRYGISSFSGKILLLAVLLLMFNPLVAHILARSAYLSGYKTDELQVEKLKEEHKGVVE